MVACQPCWGPVRAGEMQTSSHRLSGDTAESVTETLGQVWDKGTRVWQLLN